MKRVGVIAGGSGSSKFASSFAEVSGKHNFDLGFITNIADNYWYHGLYVCPDLDIIVHALHGDLDTKGWGVVSDTFNLKRTIEKISNSKEWFSLGDSDAALCVRRTELMKQGLSLSSVTDCFCKNLKIKFPVIPATDNEVTSFIKTDDGWMHLQEFWVKHKGSPKMIGIKYSGINLARPNPRAISFLKERAVICPANPVTSITPTISLKSVAGTLRKSKVVAVSPFVGKRPFSGPAGKMMKAIGREPTSFGVAKLYSAFVKLFLVHTSEDSDIIRKIKDLGIECFAMDTKVTPDSRLQIAEDIMNLL